MTDNKTLIQQIHRLLETSWPHIAGAAWAAYQTYGRGAVLIDLRGQSPLPETARPAGYASEAKIALNNPDLAPLRDMLAHYNPATTVLFVVYTPAGDTIIDLIQTPEGQKTPSALGQSP